MDKFSRKNTFKQSKKAAKNIVREHEIEILNNGLISLLGGKWTTCRKIALDALLEMVEHVEKIVNETIIIK